MTQKVQWFIHLPAHGLDVEMSISPTLSCSKFALTGTSNMHVKSKGKGSPYSTAEHRVPELLPVLGSQPAGNVSHKPGGRLPLLSARPAVTLATLLLFSLLGEQRHNGCEQFA